WAACAADCCTPVGTLVSSAWAASCEPDCAPFLSPDWVTAGVVPNSEALPLWTCQLFHSSRSEKEKIIQRMVRRMSIAPVIEYISGAKAQQFNLAHLNGN